MTLTVFKESLKLYTPLYVLNAIIRRELSAKVITSIVKNTLRSSSFLGFTALLMMSMFCNIRRFTGNTLITSLMQINWILVAIVGKFYYTLCSYLPVFVSSLFAILIEKRSRRGALALYCANIASETVYRMFVNRSYIKAIPRGEVLLYT